MEPPRHMTPEEFRRHGHDVIDWIADYFERVDSFPVLSAVEPGEVRRGLPDMPPQEGEPFERILSDMETKILPGITHWQSPRFFAFYSDDDFASLPTPGFRRVELEFRHDDEEGGLHPQVPEDPGLWRLHEPSANPGRSRHRHGLACLLARRV